MKKKINIAYIILILSIVIIIIGCGSKKKIIDTYLQTKVEKVSDSIVKTNVKTNEKKKDIILKTNDVKIEYIGESKYDSLTVTQNPNQLIISGKGKLFINNVSTSENTHSKETNSESDIVISKNLKSVLNEEIKTKEEVIKKNNGFNFYVIGLMVLIIAVLFLINYIKNKF